MTSIIRLGSQEAEQGTALITWYDIVFWPIKKVLAGPVSELTHTPTYVYGGPEKEIASRVCHNPWFPRIQVPPSGLRGIERRE